MCGCLNRSRSLSCSTWGQEGLRAAQAFTSLPGRGRAAPVPAGCSTAAAACTSPRTWDPTDPRSSHRPTSLPVCLHTERCHCSFPKRTCLFFFFQFPCHLFVFSNWSSLKAPCLCSSCLCMGYFWNRGNGEEGWNLGELTAVEEESSFPWCALSSISFLLVTSMVRSPSHRSFQGKP